MSTLLSQLAEQAENLINLYNRNLAAGLEPMDSAIDGSDAEGSENQYTIDLSNRPKEQPLIMLPTWWIWPRLRHWMQWERPGKRLHCWTGMFDLVNTRSNRHFSRRANASFRDKLAGR